MRKRGATIKHKRLKRCDAIGYINAFERSAFIKCVFFDGLNAARYINTFQRTALIKSTFLDCSNTIWNIHTFKRAAVSESGVFNLGYAVWNIYIFHSCIFAKAVSAERFYRMITRRAVKSGGNIHIGIGTRVFLNFIPAELLVIRDFPLADSFIRVRSKRHSAQHGKHHHEG